MTHSSIASKDDRENCQVVVSAKSIEAAGGQHQDGGNIDALQVFKGIDDGFVQDVKASLKAIEL